MYGYVWYKLMNCTAQNKHITYPPKDQTIYNLDRFTVANGVQTFDRQWYRLPRLNKLVC